MRSIMVTTVTLDHIDLWGKQLFVKGRSELTVKAYKTDLTVFLRELEVTEVTKEEYEYSAANWLTANRKRVAPKTTGRRLTSLRAFANWAGWGLILMDYSAPVASKNYPHPLPERIAGVYRLIDVARGERHKALIALCGLEGCRVAEAISVRPSDFDLDNMILTIRGKGDKERKVPVGSNAWGILQMPVTRAFIDGNGEVVGLKDRFARRVITDLGRRAGLARPISSHDLRATFASEVYDRTLDIRLVQELLGHSSSRTTELYTQVDQDKMRKAVEL